MAIIATAAESALGSGDDAIRVAPPGEVARTRIAVDDALRAAGSKRPNLARTAVEIPEDRDRATFLVERAFDAIALRLDEAMPTWREKRVGVSLGTSSGGMISLTRAFELLADGRPVSADQARSAPYFGPIRGLRERLGVDPAEECQVLAACASSGIAAGFAARWLEQDHVDLVITGGYDAVGLLVAAGFESLRATSASLPAPFRVDRDGMALGEAVALWALARPESSPRALGYLRGFGATADAVHVTAPDREGRGLAEAARVALSDAACPPDAVDLVSAHATATPYNDAAEAKAIHTVLGDHGEHVVVHPFKAVVGHTLGASSVLEATAALAACRRGILPGAAGEGDLDPEAAVRLLPRSESAAPDTVLELSAAFGGANCALVLSLEPGEAAPRTVRPACVSAAAGVVRGLDLESIEPLVVSDLRRLARMDACSALVVAAAGAALKRHARPLPSRTAVVVGTVTASIENDELFHRRMRERGFAAAEPRRFPATSPNLPAGSCGIAFGLRGPSLSVGAGPAAALEALLVGHDLVAAGDADAAVVVAAEHVADVVPLLFEAAGWPVPEHGAAAAILEPGSVSGALERADLKRRRADLAAADGEGAFQAFLAAVGGA